MSGETLGWGGQFWLNNGTSLVKLVGVIECGVPSITVDEHEITDLEAPGKFKQYMGGLKDGGEFTVVMNYVPQSATDLLCQAQLTQTRGFKIVEPAFDGTAEQDITGTVVVKGYEPSPMKPNEPRTATLTLRVASAPTYGASA